jgi:hypothetical protein
LYPCCNIFTGTITDKKPADNECRRVIHFSGAEVGGGCSAIAIA